MQARSSGHGMDSTKGWNGSRAMGNGRIIDTARRLVQLSFLIGIEMRGADHVGIVEKCENGRVYFIYFHCRDDQIF